MVSIISSVLILVFIYRWTKKELDPWDVCAGGVGIHL